MTERNPFIPCIHHLPVVLRDIKGCGCGGPRATYGCSHWSNEMAECVITPLARRQVDKFGEIVACMKCQHYTAMEGVIPENGKASRRNNTPTAPADDRAHRGPNSLPASRLRRMARQQAEAEGIQKGDLATTNGEVEPPSSG